MSPGVNSKERAAKRARKTLCSTFERAEVSPNLLKYDTFAQNATQGDVAYVFGILPRINGDNEPPSSALVRFLKACAALSFYILHAHIFQWKSWNNNARSN